MMIEMRYQCEACNILRVTLLAFIVLFACGVEAAPGLSLERVPDHGIQPRL
jgi:hypothetical protein